MHRPSTVAGSQARQTTRLYEKRLEWEAVAALDEMTGEMAKALKDIASQGNIIADNGRGK